MADIVDTLRREHRNMAKVLDVLERQVSSLGEGASADYGVVARVLEYCLEFPELCHHPKEDLIFQKLREREVDIPLAVRDLPAEHAELRELTWKISAALDRVRRGAEEPRARLRLMVGDFVASYRAHMTMEEKHFFPAALQRLKEEDWADIDARAGNPADPLFGARAVERFAALRGAILSSRESPITARRPAPSPPAAARRR